jgi:hypothetical protein
MICTGEEERISEKNELTISNKKTGLGSGIKSQYNIFNDLSVIIPL